MITNKVLSLEDILAADDRKPHPVDVPEWGGRVYVRGMSGVQREELEREGLEYGLASRIVAFGLCGENGEEMGWTAKQVHELGSKSAGVLLRLASKVQQLSGMSAADVEELEKNSETTPSAGSG